MKAQSNPALRAVRVQDAFWTPIQRLVCETVIPYQYAVLDDQRPGVEKTHAIENFRIAAGQAEGEHGGLVFQDSDVAKWLEGAAYALTLAPDAALEARVDALIDSIRGAQQPDGYLNTYFTLKEPEHRWQNLLDCHELYCAGHMIEAGVAYYEATGKRVLLDVCCRLADHIGEHFGVGKTLGYPGHEEIELALMRLYRATGEARYQELARYFIDQRGQEPNYFQEEQKNRGWYFWTKGDANPAYHQSHKPVREQSEAVGHCVRAVYLYSAMADIAAETGDRALFDACKRLWESITHRRMYVTGAIGSTVDGEAFTIDYDLPNDTAYAETCASIGLLFFARRMLEAEVDAVYGDVIEQALYNSVLSGMQQDGQRFFYVNPLEVVPGVSGELYGYKHVLPERPEWYTCACCPPNVARLVASLGQYAWGEAEDSVYAHLYLGGEARFQAGGGVRIDCVSGYPWSGDVRYTMHPEADVARFTFAVRLPMWCRDAEIRVNGENASCRMERGYAYLQREWREGDVVALRIALEVRRVYANPAVRADAGCVALQRGPIVYCLEEADNGKALWNLRLPRQAAIEGEQELRMPGKRVEDGVALYADEPPREKDVELRAVPYYRWANRGKGEMRVWIREA